MYALSVGADGLVPSTGNVVPGLFSELYEAVSQANMADAERLQQLTDTIADIYQKGRTLGQSLAALKVMMNERVLCEPYMLPPLTRLPRNEEEGIRESVRKIPELSNA